jgi:hypothetical protein
MVDLCPPIGKRGAYGKQTSKKQKKRKYKAASEGTLQQSS